MAVNLRPLEVYRALLGSSERIFPREEWDLDPGFFTLPIKPPARNDSRAHESSFYTGQKTWRNASEKRRVIVRGRTKFAREIFSERDFRRRDCAIVS